MSAFLSQVYPGLLKPLLAWTLLSAAWAVSRERAELRRLFTKRFLCASAALAVLAFGARLRTARTHYVFEDRWNSNGDRSQSDGTARWTCSNDCNSFYFHEATFLFSLQKLFHNAFVRVFVVTKNNL